MSNDNKTVRLDKEQRINMIINIGCSIANNIGLYNVTFDTVAAQCPIATSPSTVRYHFPRLNDLLTAMVNSGNLSYNATMDAKVIGVTKGETKNDNRKTTTL